ncbi:MAG: hypothetical protein R3D78_03415 [Paracoccaceae bacterium]|jgi:hypothetical protein
MSDRNLKDFQHRLEKIEQIHKAGGAFEAAGALGRSYFDAMRPKAHRSFPLRALAMILAGVLLLKGALLAQMGADPYDAKVAQLAAGTFPEQASAWVLHADPVTRKIAETLHPIIY